MTNSVEGLQGRPVEVALSEQKTFDGRVFPWAIEPAPEWKGQCLTAVADWFRARRAGLEEKLTQHGAALLRGFPIATPQDFDTFVGGLGWKSFPYVGGAAPRYNVVGQVFTTNESPPDSVIPFHHEMAQVPKFPGKLFFFCEVAPDWGGETAICHSGVVHDRMQAAVPNFVKALDEKGVRYMRVLPSGDDSSSPIGRGWQSTYQTADRDVVEARCRALEETIEWLPDGSLRSISRVLPAIREEPRTKRRTWFNSIIAAYEGWKDVRNDPKKAVMFGDGTPMDPDAMRILRHVMDEVAVAVPWRPGDVLVVDNHLALHARRVYGGTRKVYAALFSDAARDEPPARED